MEDDESGTAMDGIITQFNTYEDFLDSQITSLDLFYLEVNGSISVLYRITDSIVKNTAGLVEEMFTFIMSYISF